MAVTSFVRDPLMYALIINTGGTYWFCVGTNFRSIDEARKLWCTIARYADTDCKMFEILDYRGETIYKGNFITDEPKI